VWIWRRFAARLISVCQIYGVLLPNQWRGILLSPLLAPLRPALVELIHLGGHDEVVLVQAANFSGLELDPAITPAEGDLGVVELGLRQVGDTGSQSLGLDEFGEFESATDAGGVVVGQCQINASGLKESSNVGSQAAS